MDRPRIAVTGVGGGVGQSILKALFNTGYDLVGLDGEFLAAGLYAAPRSYLIPYANSPAFIPALLDICRKEQIALLFPGLDAEMRPLSSHRDDFKAIGTTVVVSDSEIIEICDDKLLTYESLRGFGIDVPWTYRLDRFVPEPASFPLIVKQKVGGARSKNVFLAQNEEELERILAATDLHKQDLVAQQFLEGDEYTCGSITLDEKCRGVIVLRRILRDGDTYKCFSEFNPAVEKAIWIIANMLKPFGACNVQLKVRNGIPYIFEINARCSGTTAAKALCGFNEPKMIADFILKSEEPAFLIKEQTILRYWKELVVPNQEVDSLRKHRYRSMTSPPSL